MSATLDGERIASWLDAPRLSSPGRSFPVRHRASAGAQRRRAWSIILLAWRARRWQENDGDVLGVPARPARDRALPQTCCCRRWIATTSRCSPLHGELSQAEQQAALAPAEPGTRRIVLATNVAESSITLPGIRAVVDAGLAREPRFDPNSGFTRLETVDISQASADQRAGRAGRVAAGTAYRLWPQSRRLEPARTGRNQPDRTVLAGAGTGGMGRAGRWRGGPALARSRRRPARWRRRQDLLARLGALGEDGRITPLGRSMLELGATPRLAAAARARTAGAAAAGGRPAGADGGAVAVARRAGTQR